MSSEIDRRIVELRFDNAQFASAVKTTMAQLDELNKALSMKDASKGLDQVESRANKFNLKGAISSVQSFFAKIGDKLPLTNLQSLENRFNAFKTNGAVQAVSRFLEKFNFTKPKDEVDGIQVSLNRMNFSPAEQAIIALNNKFSTFGIAAQEVIKRVTNSILNMANAAASVVINPIVSGGYQRAQSIENAQFTMQGLLGTDAAALEQIDKIMAKVKESVSDTAYGTDQAATAASQFLASGITDADQMLKVLQGIGGTAATVNANYDDIAHIFTTVAGNGRLMTEQLNQFSYRGMNAAATLKDQFNAVLNGTSTLSQETQDQIRAAVQYGISNVKDFTGTMESISESDLRALVTAGQINFGMFSDIMSTVFGAHAKDAQKTFTGSMANVQAALKRVGQNFYEDIIKQDSAVVQMFGKLRDVINQINESSKPFAKFLSAGVLNAASIATSALTVMQDHGVFTSMANGFQALMTVMSNVARVFADVFKIDGIETVNDLVGRLSDRFVEFMNNIRPTATEMGTFRTVLTAVFQVMRTIGSIFGAAGTVLGELWNKLAPVREQFVELAKAISPLAIHMRHWIEESETAQKIFELMSGAFEKAGNVLARGVSYIVDAVKFLDDLFFGGGLEKGPAFFIESWSNLFSKLREDVGSVIATIAPGLANLGSTIGDTFGKAAGFVGEFISNISGSESIIGKAVSAISAAFSHLGNAIVNAWNGVKNAISGIKNAFRQLFGGTASEVEETSSEVQAASKPIINVFDSIKKAATTLANVLKPVFQTIRDAFMSLFGNGNGGIDLFKILSTLNSFSLHNLTSSISNLLNPKKDKNAPKDPQETAFGIFEDLRKFLSESGKQINNTIKSFTGVMKGLQNTLNASALVKVAIAIGILAGAIYLLGSQNDILLTLVSSGALVGLVVALGVMVNMLSKIPTTSIKKFNKLSTALIKFSASMLIIAKAISSIGELDPANILVATLSIVGMMVAIIAFIKALDKFDIGTDDIKKLRRLSTALIVFGVAMRIMASTVTAIGSLPIGNAAAGILGFAGVIAALTVFLYALDKIDIKASRVAAISAAFIVLGAAMRIMASSITSIGALSFEGVAVGLLGFAGVMAAMMIFLNQVDNIDVKNSKVLAISVAFVILGGALKIISGVLKALAQTISSDVAGSIAGMVAMGAFLVVAVQVFKMAEKNNIGASAVIFGISMILLSNALKNIGAVLETLASLGGENISSLFAAAAAIGIIILVMGLLTKIVAGKDGKMSLTDSAGFAAIGASMVGIGDAIKKIGEALEIITNLAQTDSSSLFRAVAIVSLFLILIGIMAKIADNKGFSWGSDNAFRGIGDMMKNLAEAVKLLGDMEPDKAVVGTVGVIALLTAITNALTKLTSEGPKLLLAAVSIGMVTVALSGIALIVALMSAIPFEGALTAIASLYLVLTGIVVALKAFEKANPGSLLAASASMILVSTALVEAGLVLVVLGSLGWETIAKGLVAILGVLGILAGVLIILDKFTNVSVLAGAIALVLTASSLIVVGAALAIVATMPWESILAGGIAMGIALAAMAGVLVILDKFVGLSALAGAVSLIVVAVALGMVGKTLAQVGALSWETIAKGLVGALGALVLLSAVVVILGHFQIGALAGAASVLITALAVVAIGMALQQIGSMSWQQIATGLIGAVAAVLVLGLIINILGAMATLNLTGILALASILLVVSVSAVVISTALSAFAAVPFDTIAVGMLQLSTAVLQLGMAFMVGLPGVAGFAASLLVFVLSASVGAVLATAGIALLSVAILVLAADLMLFNATVTTSANVALMAIQPIVMLSTAALTLATSMLAMSAASMTLLAFDASLVIAVGTMTLFTIFAGLASGLAVVLAGALMLLAPAAATAAAAMMAIGMAAEYIGIGFANGINAAAGAVAGVVEGFCNMVAGIFTGFFGIHSPSILAAMWGAFTGEGFSLGMDSTQGMVGDSATGLSTEALTGLMGGAEGSFDIGKLTGMNYGQGEKQGVSSSREGAEANVQAALTGFASGESAANNSGYDLAAALGGGMESFDMSSITDGMNSDILGQLGSGDYAGVGAGNIEDMVSGMMSVDSGSAGAAVAEEAAHGAENASPALEAAGTSGGTAYTGGLVQSVQSSMHQEAPALGEDTANTVSNSLSSAIAEKEIPIGTPVQTELNTQLNSVDTSASTDQLTSQIATEMQTGSVNKMPGTGGQAASSYLTGFGQTGTEQAAAKAEEIFQAFHSTVPDYAGTGRAHANQYVNGFKEGASGMTEAANSLIQMGRAGLISGEGVYAPLGNLAGRAYATSLSQTKSQAFQAASQITAEALRKLKEIREFKNAGENAGRAYASALNSPSIRSAAQNAASAIGAAAVGGIGNHYQTFYNSGRNTAQGFVNGMNSMGSNVYTAAYNMGRTAINALNAATQVRSPSREGIRTGKYIGEGLSIGLMAMADTVADSGEYLGNASIEALASTLGLLDDIDLDVEPTITPVLDLSNVYAGRDALNSIFSKQAIVGASSGHMTVQTGAARVISAQEADHTQQAPEITYELTQINYSPKALNRVDIYRQTKNLFGRVARPEVLYAQAGQSN